MTGMVSRAQFGILAIIPIAGGMLYLEMRSATPGGKATHGAQGHLGHDRRQE